MKASHGMAIAGAGLVLTLPVLILGVPFLSDDAGFHAVWYTHFSHQLWAGDLYPRWLAGMNGGLGSPVFFFYPPLPYFLTSILRPFFRSDPQGWHQLGVSASLALIASGFFTYLWLKSFVDQAAALAAAILYMAMPYHLAADLYVRSSFAEYWAFVWMPLILYFIHRLAFGDKLAFVGVSVGWALLIMTHLPVTLTFSALPFCYVVLLTPKSQRLKMLVISLGAAMLGVGLSAIYLLPAMTTQKFVLLDRMTTGYFSYENWLFFAKFSWWKEDKIMLALLILDVVGLATCSFLIGRSSLENRQQRMNRFLYGIAITSTLMMTEISKPVWLVVPFIRRIQFPWRFNAVLTLATSGLLALAISHIRKRRLLATKMIAGLLIIAWVPSTLWKAWGVFPHANSDPHEISEREEELSQNRDAPEYRPRWNAPMAAIDWGASVDEKLWTTLLDKDNESLLRSVGSSPQHPPQPNVIQGSGRAEITTDKPREIDLRVEAATDVMVNVPRFYYPYWRAYLSGEGAELSVAPSQPDGLISLSVPSGNHEVQLRLERSWPELIGELISLASIAIALCLAMFLAKNRVNYASML